MTGKDGKDHFHLLEMDKADIEKEVGAKLEWGGKYARRQSYISLSMYETDPEDRQNWNRQHEWLCEQLETFHKVFSPRVKVLDASDYVPEEDETAE